VANTTVKNIKGNEKGEKKKKGSIPGLISQRSEPGLFVGKGGKGTDPLISLNTQG